MNVLKRIENTLFWNLLGSESSHAVSIVRPEGVFEIYVYLSSYNCEAEIEVRHGLFNGNGDGAFYVFIVGRITFEYKFAAVDEAYRPAPVK